MPVVNGKFYQPWRVPTEDAPPKAKASRTTRTTQKRSRRVAGKSVTSGSVRALVAPAPTSGIEDVSELGLGDE